MERSGTGQGSPLERLDAPLPCRARLERQCWLRYSRNRHTAHQTAQVDVDVQAKLNKGATVLE